MSRAFGESSVICSSEKGAKRAGGDCSSCAKGAEGPDQGFSGEEQQ